jgi:hypothetical protein
MIRHNLQPLESLLSDLSMRCFGTRWYNGMEWWGFRALQQGGGPIGRGMVSPQDVSQLREIHEELEGGWMLLAHNRAAYIGRDRWMMAYGGGPDRVVEEARRLERKLGIALEVEDHEWVDGLLQGTRPWW